MNDLASRVIAPGYSATATEAGESKQSVRSLLASCTCLLLMLSGCSHPAAQQQPTHSQAKLVLAQSAVTPGSQVKVGIQFAIDPGWHIYWMNPGDSGEAPRIEWQLPAGVFASPLQWPTPERLNSPAGTDYGYQGGITLLSSLQIPSSAQHGSLQAGGELHWLVCHDICLPQSAHLEAPLRIADAAANDASAQQTLRTAEARLPEPLPASYRPAVIREPDGFRLTFSPGIPVTKAEFFPAAIEQIDNAASQPVSLQRGEVSLTLKKSEYLRNQPERLIGVLVLNSQDAYAVNAPIHNSAATNSAAQNRSHQR